ncbi:MAG: amino acid adenylation domain-containing protein [Gammaproteobacteria bacterium]|nr:amino acid adenylation domain-containing protein [Gammaproteobacteria bacterium]
MNELTGMQAAYWVGRQASGPLTGVSAHLYAEFDGSAIDVGRMSQAVRRLFARHAMLRLQVDAQGQAHRLALMPWHELQLDDWRALRRQQVEALLLATRQRMAHQRLDLAAGRVIEWRLSLLPDGRQRLHVDLDMIAVDPGSFPLLMDELARCYESPTDGDEVALPDFLETWAQQRVNDVYLPLRQRDRQWWLDRLPQIAPAPPLPWLPPDGERAVRSQRLSTTLTAAQREALTTLARQHQLTLTNLLLAPFVWLLGRYCTTTHLRVTVPVFHRPLTLPVLGDFSDLLVVSGEFAPTDSPLTLARRLADELSGLLSHRRYSGLEVMRELSRQQGESARFPVVFTSGLNLPQGNLFSDRVERALGRMCWTTSQGPNVALDAQVVELYGELLLNWDVRLDAVPKAWIEALFADYVDALGGLVTCPAAMHTPLAEAFPAKGAEPYQARPLSALQRAYLLGRSAEVALGGVAMQEFREYGGPFDAETLHQRLVTLIKHHAALRTCIDYERLRQYVLPPETAEDIARSLRELDLRCWPVADARAHLGRLRQQFAHEISDLRSPPWSLLLIHLPEGCAEPGQLLFTRFDALILDGHGIAMVLSQLLAPQPLQLPQAGVVVVRGGGPDRRLEDGEYWQAKLAAVEGPPQLPWLQPLANIRQSRYRRQSVSLSAAALHGLTRLGAAHGLLRNSLLAALILDTLCRWNAGESLCVALPVAVPQATGELTNHSSFIALCYPRAGGLLPCARQLQSDVLTALEHLEFSGVDLSRQLMARNGGDGPALPVVLTNGMGWPRLPPGAPQRQQGGLTQTPHVALDIRLMLDEAGALLISTDYAEQALSADWVSTFLDTVIRGGHAVLARGELQLESYELLDLSHYGTNHQPLLLGPENYLQRLATQLWQGDPQRTAVICNGRLLSYGQLGQRVAAAIVGLQQRGVTVGDLVAIYLQRSPEHLVVTLACALSGVIWVPLDVTSPGPRLAYLLENCRPQLVVADVAISGWPVVRPEQLLNDNPVGAIPIKLAQLAARGCSEAPAYCLYTSGTTGRPKCVVLNHLATDNVVRSTHQAWRISAADVFISVTPLHHDMSLFDIFGALSMGSALVLPTASEERDALAWNRLVREHHVTLWCSVPAILEMLLASQQTECLRSLRLIAQGGDYIKPAVIAALRELLPQCQLYSLGGPTETTIWSIWHPLTPADVAAIPYGQPLPGNAYYLLDERGDHCPSGVVGRIYTSGINVALGYLEQGQLVQHDFVQIKDEHGRWLRAYRSGDLGRYRPDGTLMFSGRTNGYIKIRGVRVSLPDIEHELAEHPAISQLLVVDYLPAGASELALGALYVGGELTVAELRQFARQQLPGSHVPIQYLRLPAALPLSANGKPDRHQARALLAAGQVTHNTAICGANTLGKRVLAIYLEELGTPARLAVDELSPFLALGLLPSHLPPIANRLRVKLGAELSVSALLRCRNAQQVAALIAQHPAAHKACLL